MAACGSREELRRRVIEAFAAREEVYRVCLFGREAEGTQDSYSDIDMVVCSSDLAMTLATYRDVFASISPLRATFTLAATPDGYSEMVMLRDYSPYQKVDFSIGDSGKQGWNLVTVYDSPQKCRPSPTSLCAVPIRRDVAYKLCDILFFDNIVDMFFSLPFSFSFVIFLIQSYTV